MVILIVYFQSQSLNALRGTYESTNRSLLAHPGFLGLKVMNLLKRTCATGAIPIGAPG